MVNLDCADPRRMAGFYSALLGWETPFCEDEYSMVSNGSTSIGFGRIDGYSAPPWPDEQHAKQYHLDFRVEDLARAEAVSVELGATVPEFQPGGDRWRGFWILRGARSAWFPLPPSPELGGGRHCLDPPVLACRQAVAGRRLRADPAAPHASGLEGPPGSR
jgi:hypothetical protein